MYQKIIIAGYLGRDPEMRYLPSGTPVTNFSVATSRRWTGQDGQQQEETVWFRIAVFGRQAEVCNQYLSKGRPVLIEGRMRPDENGNPRVWTGQDGVARASFEVTAESVRFLSGRGDTAAVPGEPEEMLGEEEEEIPF
jgi:single-strand DNA-binding protein